MEKSGQKTSQRYHLKFIEKVVQEVEFGATQISVINKYNLNKTTVNGWMQKYGSQEFFNTRQARRYSTNLKRKVLLSIKEGKMSIQEAKVAYEITSVTTIKNWLLEDCNNNYDLCKIPIDSIDMPDNSIEIDIQETEVLKKALAEAQFKIEALNTLIDVAEKNLKIEIRKKSGTKQLKK